MSLICIVSFVAMLASAVWVSRVESERAAARRRLAERKREENSFILS